MVGLWLMSMGVVAMTWGLLWLVIKSGYRISAIEEFRLYNTSNISDRPSSSLITKVRRH